MRYYGYKYLIALMFFVMVMFGTFFCFRYIVKEKEEELSPDVKAVSNNEDKEDEKVEIYSEKENLKDIKVIYEDYYSLCLETVEKEENFYQASVEKVKENEIKKQKNEGKKYSVVYEDEEKIVFKRTIAEFCPNHFFIKAEDNLINIYRKITDRELELYKKLKVSPDVVREELKDRLKQGIEADSKEELNLIVEDIES